MPNPETRTYTYSLEGTEEISSSLSDISWYSYSFICKNYRALWALL